MIDWAQVERLSEDMGGAFDEVVEVFLAEADEAVAALESSGQGKERAAALHFLKGAALNLGFADFGGLCAAGEKLAHSGAEVDLAPVLASYTASRARFLAGLAARSQG